MEEVCRGKNKTKQHISVLHNRKSGKQTDKHLGDILLFVSSAIINWHLFIILKRKKKLFRNPLCQSLSQKSRLAYFYKPFEHLYSNFESKRHPKESRGRSNSA